MSPFVNQDQWLAKLIRPEIQALNAYHVPPASGYVKLDAMENPHDWPAPMREAWLARLAGVAINRYPDPTAAQLTPLLRQVMGVPESAGLMLGNGSDELIQILAIAVGGPGRVILAPEPSFVMYRIIAQMTGAQFVGVPLNPDDFSLDSAAIEQAIRDHAPAIIFLAYPNNPTGNLFDTPTLERILDIAPGLVVIDEAYQAFAETSRMESLARHPNLVVLRTLSKMGLAGLRLGVLAAAPALVNELDKVRMPYNVGVLTQVTAVFALEHASLLWDQAAQIRQERTRLYNEMGALPGTRVFPSQANFLLFRVPAGRAVAVFEELRRQRILIKCFHGGPPALADCLRVTVGTSHENNLFLSALRGALAQII